MNISDIINKKENNIELTKEEIEYVVTNYVNNTINDKDMTLLLKAIVKNDMSENETINLTIAMLNSGNIMDLSNISGIKVDKHSTGGVGDKTTLIVAPMVACFGALLIKCSASDTVSLESLVSRHRR
jgi:pyrimidine-nucleoside phosphorylase